MTTNTHHPTNGRRRRASRAQPAEATAGPEAEQRRGTFTSDRGKTVAINGVSPWMIQALGDGLRAEWAEAGKPMPDAPTYTIELPGGDQETRPHDATTLHSDEDRAAWAAYQQRRAQFEEELKERTMRLLFIRGVQTPDLEDGSDWIEEQRFIGVRVPANKLERRYWWVKTELISSPDEAVDLMESIMGLSGVGEEALRNARDAFRDQVEVSDRAAAGAPAAEHGGLVPQPDSAGGESRPGDGEVAE